MQIRFILLFLTSLFFVGCSTKNLEVKTVQVERTQLKLPEPDAVKMKDINFYIITEKNSNSIFEQLKYSNKDKALICLSDDDYIKMSENLFELKQYIIRQRQIIKAYKDYYENQE